MTIKGGRGLGEPSLALFEGTYYITMRSNFTAYVATSKNGMDWKPFKEWKFDDGEVLGSYNTQAHWLVQSDSMTIKEFINATGFHYRPG